MKNILVSCWCIALCVGLLLYSFAAVPASQSESPAPTESSSTLPTAAPIQLYVVNTNPDLQVTWELLALEFYRQSGIEVLVTTEKASPKNAHLITASTNEVAEMDGALLDLRDTAAYAQLASPDFSMTKEDQVVAIAADMAIFGLIYNETLLARAGYTRSDVDCFEDLVAVAQHITTDAQKLGFGAFAKSKGNLTQLLSSYPEDCRGIWDLYQANWVDGSVAEGKAVFCLGSNLELESLSRDPELKLGMLPLYVGNGQDESKTFCAVTTRYWCILPGEDPDSNQAAMAFLNFLVSPQLDGSVPVDDLRLLAPYRQANFGDNSAETLLRSDIAAGKQCQICVPPVVPDGLMEALLIYEAEPTDANWEAISQLLPHT